MGGVERRLDWHIHLALHMAKQAKAREDANGRRCFVVVFKPQFTNLCFYIVPPSLRETVAKGIVPSTDPAEADTLTQLTDDQVSALGKVSVVVKDRMQREGKAMIGFQPVKVQ